VSLAAQDEALARRVGAISLALIAIAIVFFVFVYDRIEWGRHVRIRVYFHHVSSLREGAPFVVAGRGVGKVETIAPLPRGAKGPLGGEDGVVVTVAIDAGAARELDRAGDVFIASRGTLSERYLELGPPPEASAGTMLHEGDELVGRDPPSLDRVLQRTWDNLNTVGGVVDELRPEVAALRSELDKLQATLGELAPDVHLRDDIGALIAEATRTYDALGDRPGTGRIGALADHARTTIAQARTMIAALRTRADALGAGIDGLRGRLGTKGAAAIDAVELAVDRVKAAIDKVDPLLAQVDALQQRIERGEGSLLKLMHDPEFPEDAKELGKILKRQPWKLMDHPSN